MFSPDSCEEEGNAQCVPDTCTTTIVQQTILTNVTVNGYICTKLHTSKLMTPDCSS